MALKKCKECGNQVSTKADKCPKCGVPVKKGINVGCLGSTIAIFIVVCLVWALSNIDPKEETEIVKKKTTVKTDQVTEKKLYSWKDEKGKWQFSYDLNSVPKEFRPEEINRKNKKKDILANKGLERIPHKAKEKPDRENLVTANLQKKRKIFIEKIISQGIFQKIQTIGRYPRLFVKPDFYNIDFDEKQSLVSVVWLYYFNLSPEKDRDDYFSVIIKDSRTAKKVGLFDKDFGLKLY